LSASCWRSSFRLADNSLGFHLPLQRTPPVIDGHGRNSAHPFAGRVSDSFFLLSPSFSGAVVQTSQTLLQGRHRHALLVGDLRDGRLMDASPWALPLRA
jgi:hypothetical protein